MDESQIKAQVSRLEAVKADPKLVSVLSSVVAASFGVIPLAVNDENGERRIEVAAAPTVNGAAMELLGRILERRVEVVPFEPQLVQIYLSRLYLKSESVNFNTFVEEDFLARPESIDRLTTEKDGEPVKPHVRPDPERIVLLDLAYRSVLENLDVHMGSTKYEAGETELPFGVVRGPIEGMGRAVLRRDEDLPPSVLILASESYSYDGIEHSHGFRAHEIRKLPHNIHPTEVQITGVESTGAVHFYVYDRVVRVAPGETPRFDLAYHFLSGGNRYRRRLAIQVYELTTVKRIAIRRTSEPIPWTPAHLTRWLGYDLE